MTYTHNTPFEIDTHLASLYTEAAKQRGYRDAAADRLAKTDRNGDLVYTSPSVRESFAATVAKAEAKLAEIATEAAPGQAEFSARQWSRFFLVTNGNGHVHSSLHCSTCYLTTEFAWLPELSGKTEGDAVEEFGEKMCTVCFPSAPADPRFRAPGRRDAEAAAAKAAEKAAKTDAKLEKALLPTGEALALKGYDSPTTLVAAQRVLSSTLKSIYGYNVLMPQVNPAYSAAHPDTPTWEADVATLVEAIAAKTGRDATEILTEAKAKAEKAAKKEWGV